MWVLNFRPLANKCLVAINSQDAYRPNVSFVARSYNFFFEIKTPYAYETL